VLYVYGLGQIPEQAFSAPPPVLPAMATKEAWVYLGGAGEPRIARLNPYTYLGLLLQGDDRLSPERQVAMMGARALVRDMPHLRFPERVLAQISAIIWVGQHWTAEQALSAFLAWAYFGHRFSGLEAAAQGYFGVPVDRLRPDQLAHLVVVTRAPTQLDPWCHANQNQSAARYVMSRLPQEPENKPLGLIEAPAGACSQSVD
jgi:hypothetical protein